LEENARAAVVLLRRRQGQRLGHFHGAAQQFSQAESHPAAGRNRLGRPEAAVGNAPNRADIVKQEELIEIGAVAAGRRLGALAQLGPANEAVIAGQFGRIVAAAEARAADAKFLRRQQLRERVLAVGFHQQRHAFTQPLQAADAAEQLGKPASTG